MKTTFHLTDESFRADMDKLWKMIRRLRDESQFHDVTFTLQNWVLSCDGTLVKSGENQGTDLTALFQMLPFPPTNGDVLQIMAAYGVDVATDLPARLSYTVDVEYTDGPKPAASS
jgi:hypothetical protein